MSIIDTYGEFEEPEEKSVIEVVENPVQVVMSAYEMFRKITIPSIEKYVDQRISITEQKEKTIYENIEKIFEGKENLKINIDTMADILDLLIRKIKLPLPSFTGFFLSALQNKTDLDTLIIHHFPYVIYNLGYKLAPNKKIIAIENNLNALGKRCEGIIINVVKDDIQHMAHCAQGGIQINIGDCSTIGLNRKDGIQINIGQIINSYSERNQIIEIGSLTKFPTPEQNKTEELIKIIYDYFRNYSYEDKLNFFKTFDWKAFEKEIKEFAEEYKEKIFGAN